MQEFGEPEGMAPIPMEMLDNVQDEIAYLKKRAIEAINPTIKYMHYMDLIIAGLQAIDDDDFKTAIKDKIDNLDFTESEFWNYVKRGHSADMVERFLYAGRLNDIGEIWSRVAFRLIQEDVIAIRPKSVYEMVEEAIMGFLGESAVGKRPPPPPPDRKPTQIDERLKKQVSEEVGSELERLREE